MHEVILSIRECFGGGFGPSYAAMSGCKRRLLMNTPHWLVRLALVIGIILGVIAIISGFWITAPLVLVLCVAFAVAWTHRRNMR